MEEDKKMENTEEKKIEYKETEKYKAWVQCFYDRKDKVCYFNATQSALKAYNLDPETQYQVAGVIGSNNLKKTKNIAAAYAEDHGMSLGTMLDFAVERLNATKRKEWWDALMEQFGYTVEREQTDVTVTVPVQINNKIEAILDKYR